MESFLELAKTRYSVRKYADRPVEPEKIAAVIEAGRIAPSARNCQPWVIYAVTSEEKRKALAGVCRCTFDAPVIFVVGYHPALASGGIVTEGYSFGNTDCAIAASHMMLEAADLGLGTCWVGMFVSEQVKEVLGLPEDVMVCDLMPMGYPAEDSAPSPRHAEVRPAEETVVFL